MKRFSIQSIGLIFFVLFSGCSDNRIALEECVQGADNFAECVSKRAAQQEARAAKIKAKTLELSDDAVSYLYELSLIRGHLWVGHQLALNGYQEHAIMHAKHPEDEIYSSLVDVFDARGVDGFSEELRRFSEAVEAGRKGRVRVQYQELVEAVKQSYINITPSTEELLNLINRLLRHAATEYAVGIIDGKVDNVHEYQDARGFTEIALRWTRSQLEKSSLKENERTVTSLLKEKLEDVLIIWPELVPSGDVPFDASRLFGLAADVEIMTLSL